MGRTQGKPRERFRHLLSLLLGTAMGISIPTAAWAQVRGKLPDRGVYSPPQLGAAGELPRVPDQQVSGQQVPTTRSDSSARQVAAGNQLADFVRDTEMPLPKPAQASVSAPSSPFKPGEEGNRNRPLVEVDLDIPGESENTSIPRAVQSAIPTQINSAATRPVTPALRQVSHQEIDLAPPRPPADFEPGQHSAPIGKLAGYPQPAVVEAELHHDATCDGCDHCGPPVCDEIGCGIFGCDSCGDFCDTLGCDSMGGFALPWYHRWLNGSLSLRRDRWFGGIEYLMMWRRGDRLPPLVTTEVTEGQNTATVLLVGQERIMERMGSGGRVTIGTWLDDHQCLSLVGRGWYGGRKTYDYDQNQDQTPILLRPFLNVSDDQDPEEDTQVIASPERASGSIHIGANSEAFGADVSIRQFLYGDLGATVDFLYGYQFMRLNEWLGIDTDSTALDDEFVPEGTMLSVSDHFQTSNEFHGGQVGFAANYRECCWSFNGLLKVGFGSLTRRATRTGQTITQVDDAISVDPQGLLVRSTNDGTFTDRTFGWVPELDLSLGWHRYPGWDLTFGYHVIAMTDALQPSGAIDPDLAVNLSEPPLGEQRPSDGLRYRTFYLHGIHFGLQHVY